MSLFRRAIGWIFLLVGLALGLMASAAILIVRRMTHPSRQRLWATPADIGLAYEEVTFTAKDGVALAGWFVSANRDSQRHGATILLIHGWPWNRLGNAAEDRLSELIGVEPVDLLRLAHGLHLEGYHVLMFDLRNHGESGADPPVTFGWRESEDVLAALAYLNGRADTSAERTGVVGFAMGANALLYALPQTTQIRAAVAVQPTTISDCGRRAGADLLGPFGRFVLPMVEFLYHAAGGPPFASLKPAVAAARSGDTPILYVQGDGDPWGSPDDVTKMALASREGHGPLLIRTINRSGAHRYVVDNPKILIQFLEQHLTG
jgi:pimeloyl-ACP methyl ester carboxylesterase